MVPLSTVEMDNMGYQIELGHECDVVIDNRSMRSALAVKDSTIEMLSDMVDNLFEWGKEKKN